MSCKKGEGCFPARGQEGNGFLWEHAGRGSRRAKCLELGRCYVLHLKWVVSLLLEFLPSQMIPFGLRRGQIESTASQSPKLPQLHLSVVS